VAHQPRKACLEEILALAIPHLTNKDPDEPESSCETEEDDVQQEAAAAIAATVVGVHDVAFR